MHPVILLLIGSFLIGVCPRLSPSVPQPASVAQDTEKLSQILKAATDLRTSRPAEVAPKLDPLLAELRQLRASGALTPATGRIYQDALLLLVRTRAMLLAPEPEITASFRELLLVNPRIDEGTFNPREKMLLEAIRSTDSGRLDLQTTPPGASLFYFGSELGKTPLDVPLIAGAYRLQLRLPGYFEQDFEAAIRPSEILKAVHTLRRRTVEIPLATNAPNTKVLLNGQVVGVSQGYASWLASLPPEKRADLAAAVQKWNADPTAASFFRLVEAPTGEPVTLEFQAACYQTFTMTLTIAEKDVDWAHPMVVPPELRRVELKADMGSFEVISNPPGAAVWLDGALQGVTPVGKEACVGSHRLHVTHRAGQFLQELEIRRGQTTKVSGELKPGIAFLGIHEQNPWNRALSPANADWETAGKRMAARITAFAMPSLTREEILSLQTKGMLPVEKLLNDDMSASDTYNLLQQIAGDILKVDMLLVGVRAGGKYSFRLYNTIHPLPDRIELPVLDEAALDFLIGQIDKAGKIGERIQINDLGIDVMDSPKGLLVLNVPPEGAAVKVGLAPGAIVKSIDQKTMILKDLQCYLRSKQPGQSVSLEVQTGKEGAAAIVLPLRRTGTEYPWNLTDGFVNSTLTMLQHIIDLEPGTEKAEYARLSIARGLMAQKEWKLALGTLSETRFGSNKRGVCDGTVLFYQGQCYEEIGDRAEAAKYYQRAKEFTEATLASPDGLSIPVLAEQRIRALKQKAP